MDILFTCFTPCFNGGKYIHRVFESLSCQTFTHYEWIIVNDGSTDNTDEIIQDLIFRYKKILKQIIYINQERSGKHMAWNKAVLIAKGKYFIPCDCDDSFVPYTLEFFRKKIKLHTNITMLSGINVCCYNPIDNKIHGTPYINDGLISNNIELDYKYHIKGEHWGAVKTQLLKDIPFPQIKGHFYSENYLWYSLALKGYKVICYNKPLRAYYCTPTSLVNNRKKDKNRFLMFAKYYWWCFSSAGSMIAECSKKEWLIIGLRSFSNFLKYTIS